MAEKLIGLAVRKSKIKAILFDKDGVLIDFQMSFGLPTLKVMQTLSNGNDAVLRALADEVGFDLETNIIDAHSPIVAGSTPEFCALWADVLSCENDADFLARIDKLYLEFLESSTVLIGGVPEILQELEPHYYLGLATNDTESGARSQLNYHEIIDHFGFLAGYDSGYGSKPNTGMARAFIAQTGLAPEQIVMVGDSVHDMVFARTAGLVAIGVSSWPQSKQLLGPHCDFFIDNLSALPDLLTTL